MGCGNTERFCADANFSDGSVIVDGNEQFLELDSNPTIENIHRPNSCYECGSSNIKQVKR